MTTVDDALLEKLNTLIVVINNEGKILHTSQSVERMLGYSPEYLSGRQWWIFAGDSKKEKKESLLYISSLLKSQPEISSFTFERKIKVALGQSKWIQWNLSRNNENSLIGIGYDISNQKVVEEKLKKINEQLTEKNEEITDSIAYAQRLQQAILPNLDKLKNKIDQAFVFYQPKDLLSGDFYWYHVEEEKILVFAIDCTGHGVPGALMSVLANSIVKEVVLNKKIFSPAKILYAIDEELYHALNNNEKLEVTHDGMDVSIVQIDLKNQTLTFAGAFQPMYLLRNGTILEFNANRYPIGYYQNINKEFEESIFSTKKGDQLFLFSDGFSDQFGGEEGKKFNKKRFLDLLIFMEEMNEFEKKSYLSYAHQNWKQQEEQTDDLLVIGLKL